MAQVKVLSRTTTDFERRLYEINQLALSVFEPERALHKTPTNSRQLQIDDWKQRLQQTDACIFYVTDEIQQPTAFFFTHPRSTTKDADARDSYQEHSYHIYLAAVQPGQRGKGLFKLLIGATKQKATECGYQSMTVATIPARFPRMYGLLSRPSSGWKPIEEKIVEMPGGSSERKVVMQIVLD